MDQRGYKLKSVEPMDVLLVIRIGPERVEDAVQTHRYVGVVTEKNKIDRIWLRLSGLSAPIHWVEVELEAAGDARRLFLADASLVRSKPRRSVRTLHKRVFHAGGVTFKYEHPGHRNALQWRP